MCSKVYSDVTDFEVCGFTESTKMWISPERTFSSNKNIRHYIGKAKKTLQKSKLA